jgi:hypothetical protein
MAFVMREGWKREPESITGAEYVEPSATGRLLTELDNHFGFYLHGRQITAGEQVRPPDGSPFLAGPAGERAAQRAKAADEAVPRIIERLRPRYGRMYNFDYAQPGNVRLMAMAIQPTLPDR